MWKNKIITQAKFQIVYADFKFYLYFMVSEIYPELEAKLQKTSYLQKNSRFIWLTFIMMVAYVSYKTNTVQLNFLLRC